MTVISAFYPMYNSIGKNDSSGAFQPEAASWCESQGGAAWFCRGINNHNTKSKMREEVLYFVREMKPDVIGFFCHGWRDGMQFGFNNANVSQMANEIAECGDNVRVVLYACNTADGTGIGGDGGFADRLRDALCFLGAVHCQVDAHDRPGHTTRNPYVRRFMGQGSNVGGTGGQWIVAPKSALWKRWVDAMKGDMRFKFPFMSVSDIHNELQK